MRIAVTLCITIVLVFSAAVSMAADEKLDTSDSPQGEALPVQKAVAGEMQNIDKDRIGADEPEEPPMFVPKDELQKGSYAIGVDIGRNFKAMEMNLDIAAFVAGIQAAMAGESLALDENELREAIMKLNTRIRAKQRERTQIEKAKKEAEWAELHPDQAKEKADKARKNAEEGAAFLAENAKKEGVVILPSGLQYRIIKEGDGPSPKATDVVTTHYKGTFIDGTEFDSSYKRGQPASFSVGGVIKGWTEALQLMKVGSKWELFIPANLAYGAHGRGASMPPNATLLFEVELLEIKGMDARND